MFRVILQQTAAPMHLCFVSEKLSATTIRCENLCQFLKTARAKSFHSRSSALTVEGRQVVEQIQREGHFVGGFGEVFHTPASLHPQWPQLLLHGYGRGAAVAVILRPTRSLRWLLRAKRLYHDFALWAGRDIPAKVREADRFATGCPKISVCAKYWWKLTNVGRFT